MSSIDLQDAYHLVSIAEPDRKYLRFRFNGKVLEYVCLPFGLNTAPYLFTKIMTPIVAWLREQGFESVTYLDDIYLLGKSFKECKNNVFQTRRFLEKLGFVINEAKSNLNPTQICRLLGLILNSKEMRIELPNDKKINIINSITRLEKRDKFHLREFASLIGTLGSCCHAAKYGWVYLKDLEREKFFL